MDVQRSLLDKQDRKPNGGEGQNRRDFRSDP